MHKNQIVWRFMIANIQKMAANVDDGVGNAVFFGRDWETLSKYIATIMGQIKQYHIQGSVTSTHFHKRLMQYSKLSLKIPWISYY